jgi:hypothetical protein
MITGIGTPKSHSNAPRPKPMTTSLEAVSLILERLVEYLALTTQDAVNSSSQFSGVRHGPCKVRNAWPQGAFPIRAANPSLKLAPGAVKAIPALGQPGRIFALQFPLWSPIFGFGDGEK